MLFLRAPALARHPWAAEITIGVMVAVFSVIIFAAWSEHSLARVVTVAAGVVLVLVVPGWCLAVIAFPVRDRIMAEHAESMPRALDIIERLTLAIIFSIAITSAVVFVLAREVRAAGVSLTPRLLFGTLIALSALLATGAWARIVPRARLHAAAIAFVFLGAYAAHWTGTAVTIRAVALEATALIVALALVSVGKRIADAAAVRFPALVPFGRYAVIGAGNTMLDFGIYTALTRGFPFWGRHYLIANAITFVIVVTWSFYWNRRWSFHNCLVRSQSAASDEPSGGRALPAARRRSEQATFVEGMGPRANRKVRPVLGQYIRFVSATAVSLGLAEGALAAGVAIGLRDLIAKALAAPLVVLWNFCMYRFWAFRRPRRDGTV